MPLYTYVCDTCGRRKTALRSIAERDNPVVCDRPPDFGHHDGLDLDRAVILMRRTYEPAATHFHGPGVTRGSEAKPQSPEHRDESPA